MTAQSPRLQGFTHYSLVSFLKAEKYISYVIATTIMASHPVRHTYSTRRARLIRASCPFLFWCIQASFPKTFLGVIHKTINSFFENKDRTGLSKTLNICHNEIHNDQADEKEVHQEQKPKTANQFICRRFSHRVFQRSRSQTPFALSIPNESRTFGTCEIWA